MTRVPILMYHSIGGSDRLAVHPEAFDAQMAFLYYAGFTPITFGDLTTGVSSTAPQPLVSAFDPMSRAPGFAGAGFSRGGFDLGGAELGFGGAGLGFGRAGVKPIVITFDDGYADFHERALPVLQRYGFPATVFVTTGWVRDAGPYAAGRPLGPMLSWSQIRELAASGIEVGGHGHSHAQLDQLSDSALRAELHRNKDLLEDRLGMSVTTMAYPFGYSSARVRAAVAQAGYRATCVVANMLGTGDPDLLMVPRLTVRASTSLRTFSRVVEGRGIPLIFFKDRALTKGWAVIRRSRYALRRAWRGG